MKSCKRQRESRSVKRKKKEVDRLALFHDDLLLEILKKIPPDLLRYKVRFVCKRWFILTTNRILLDHASLILEKSPPSGIVRLMDIREEKEGLKMKEQLISLPYMGNIKSWCNEYLLINCPQEIGSLYLFNLITNEVSFLPPCSTSCGGHYRCKCGVGLSYDEFKGVYKIVHVFMGPPVQCELLVLESNTACYLPSDWKKVNGPIYAGQRQFYWNDPVSVRGRYFHWDVHCPKYLLSMDTVKERFRLTSLPGPDRVNTRYTFFEMDGFLTLLHKTPFDQVNVWVLRDFKRTRWEKIYSICILSYVCFGIDYPGSAACYPVASVRSRRYIVFRKRGSKKEMGLYSYDLKNEILEKLDFEFANDERCVVHSTTARFFV